MWRRSRSGPARPPRERAEIDEHAKKVGVRTPLEALGHPEAIGAHRDAYCAGIREFNARGPSAGAWTIEFIIRCSAYDTVSYHA